MRVLVDTNTLLSALVFPNGVTAHAFRCVLEHHRLVLSTYVIDEAKRVVAKKFPSYIDVISRFLDSVACEIVYTPDKLNESPKRMRDPKDEPILLTAEKEDVDIILTGDLDFHALGLRRPEVLNPRDFLLRYSEPDEK